MINFKHVFGELLTFKFKKWGLFYIEQKKY